MLRRAEDESSLYARDHGDLNLAEPFSYALPVHLMHSPSTCSPFGGFLDEIREERVKPAPSTRRPVVARPPRPRLPQGADPDLRLEAGVVSGDRAPRRSRWRWASSFVLHGACLFAVVLLPVLRSDPLPSPASATKAFFVEHVFAAPLPPPPPTRTLPARAPRSASVPRPETLAAPVEAPPEVKPDDVVDLPDLESGTAEGGVPGGVDGGVSGGIIGGVIGREAPAERAPPSRVRVGVDVKEPKKLKDVAPVYPDVAASARIEGVVIVELTIRPDGRVADVRVLRGIPLLDGAAVTAARQWVFARTLLDGVPVSVTMTVPVRFKLTS